MDKYEPISLIVPPDLDKEHHFFPLNLGMALGRGNILDEIAIHVEKCFARRGFLHYSVIDYKA
jgi:hypothetical protein